ncbi:MAG: hypothetical protein DRI36_01985 [Caldiserica bacterium]|nr:MAG: hypothetical protein DRI36_01985 [Caldisericota bacterium]
MKIVFFSSVNYGSLFIDYFLKNKIEITLITNPPKKAGRGLKVKRSFISKYAIDAGIPVIEVEELLNNEDFIKKIKDFMPCFGIVIGYGKKIPENVYSIPKNGTFNIHFSLLPDLRGPEPVRRAIFLGYDKTGVTIFKINQEIDKGDIYLQREVNIFPDDNYLTLRERLSKISIELLDEFFKNFKNIKPRKQKGSGNYAHKFKKSDFLINWNEEGDKILRRIRALYPLSYTVLPDGRKLKIIEAEFFPLKYEGKPGELVSFVRGKGFIVRSMDSSILVKRVQLEGKRVMSGVEFIIGRKWLIGKILGK